MLCDPNNPAVLNSILSSFTASNTTALSTDVAKEDMIIEDQRKARPNPVFAYGERNTAADDVLGPLYVVGGQQRAPRSVLDNDQQWYNYQKGLILYVDPQAN